MPSTSNASSTPTYSDALLLRSLASLQQQQVPSASFLPSLQGLHPNLCLTSLDITRLLSVQSTARTAELALQEDLLELEEQDRVEQRKREGEKRFEEAKRRAEDVRRERELEERRKREGSPAGLATRSFATGSAVAGREGSGWEGRLVGV